MNRFKNAEENQRVTGDSQRCYRGTLGCINILLIGVGVLLIGIAAYGKQHIELVTLPALAGILASGILLIVLSVLGLIGVSRRSQVILFIYMCIMAFLFIVLLSFSIAALSMTSNHQRILIRTAWSASNEKQKNQIEMSLGCCGLLKGDNRTEWCEVHPLTYNATSPCYQKLKEPIAKAAQSSGGVGLFFALTLLIAVYTTVKHRNQMRATAVVQGDVFL